MHKLACCSQRLDLFGNRKPFIVLAAAKNDTRSTIPGCVESDGSSRRLAPGMVTTVEPGIYVAVDDETVEERWRGIGVRIEDDILVTETGNENLTQRIPKAIDEVEAACRGEILVPAAG